jgi:iron complex outermembrane recepter protein
MKFPHRSLPLALWLAGLVTAASAEPSERSAADLTRLSLEELMNLEVTSVSKRAEKLSQAPAPIHVLTSDDIRRSGATSLPEALRLAPGVTVGRADSHNWAVGMRGFNGVFANKLLVLQDGRSMYTPSFSGVYWDQQDVFMEDLDRVEVIRGPGVVLWGANAVNGVINILTKPAKDTQGMLLTGGGGSEETGFGGLRYGGQLGEKTWYRVYGKYFNRDDSLLPSGTEANDSWYAGRGGFRVDWEPSDASRVMFSGNLHGSRLHQTYVMPSAVGVPFNLRSEDGFSGGHLLGRWTREFSEDSELQIQAYYDRTDRSSAIYGEHRHTGDLSVQHRFAASERHELTWGLGYRVSDDKIGNSTFVALMPSSRTLHLFTGFLRGKITLREDRWWLIPGVHLEHNDFTGVEVQPGVRLLWTPDERNTFWAAGSRGVRTPSRAENDIVLNQTGAAPGVINRITGSPNVKAEEMWAGQLGWRAQWGARFGTDLSLFHQNYDGLRSVELTGVTPGVPTIVNATIRNGIKGESFGLEFAPRWQVTDRWQLQAAYSYLNLDLRNRPGSTDPVSALDEGSSPRHQLSLRSSLELHRDVDLDWTVRYMESLPNLGIPSYVELDARLAWRPRPNLELAVVGQNLLDNQHPEFLGTILRTVPTEVQRGVYARLTWRF